MHILDLHMNHENIIEESQTFLYDWYVYWKIIQMYRRWKHQLPKEESFNSEDRGDYFVRFKSHILTMFMKRGVYFLRNGAALLPMGQPMIRSKYIRPRTLGPHT